LDSIYSTEVQMGGLGPRGPSHVLFATINSFY
jgi:hypothetical protein